MLPSAGVRYHVAPSNRSARACSTPAVSAPASGWPPTKRSSAPATRDHALGRADVGDDAVGAGRGERLRDGTQQLADRGGDEHDLGAGDGVRDVLGLLVDRAQGERAGAHVGVGVVAAHARAGARARGESDRAADQPDAEDRDPHPLRAGRLRLRRRCDRGRTRASPCSTSTVVSQPMQPSVIDWP